MNLLRVLFFLLFPLIAFGSETKNLIVKSAGEAEYNFTTSQFESSDYALFSYGAGNDPIFLEFDISSLKSSTIESASLKFTWAGGFGPATNPAWAKISKGKISGNLTGNAANDANNGTLKVGEKLSSIISATQDTIYTIDITSYLSSTLVNSNIISFAIDSYMVAPGIYAVDNIETLPAQLVVKYTNDSIPEPSTYAVIFGILALGFVSWRRRK